MIDHRTLPRAGWLSVMGARLSGLWGPVGWGGYASPVTAGTGSRLLLTERDALLPILRRTPVEAFDRPTVCTGWTVRDVLAHCGCALTRAADGSLHRFTPELNEMDVAERRSWALERVLAELEQGYRSGGACGRS
jgi:Mycothiol maleylpyruvate isomerase N-terminal domain